MLPSIFRDAVWNVRLFVSVNGMMLDPRQYVSLSPEQLTEALSEIPVSGSMQQQEMKYASLLYLGNMDQLRPYEARFTVTLNEEVLKINLERFREAIINAWSVDKNEGD